MAQNGALFVELYDEKLESFTMTAKSMWMTYLTSTLSWE